MSPGLDERWDQGEANKLDQENLKEGRAMPTYKVTFREATGEKREETVVAESHGEALAKAGPARAEESVEIREDE